MTLRLVSIEGQTITLVDRETNESVIVVTAPRADATQGQQAEFLLRSAATLLLTAYPAAMGIGELE